MSCAIRQLKSNFRRYVYALQFMVLNVFANASEAEYPWLSLTSAFGKALLQNSAFRLTIIYLKASILPSCCCTRMHTMTACTYLHHRMLTPIHALQVEIRNLTSLTFGGDPKGHGPRPQLLIDYVGSGCGAIVISNSTDVRSRSICFLHQLNKGWHNNNSQFSYLP